MAGGSLALRIENSDLITVIVLPLKYEFPSVKALCTGCHFNLSFGHVGLSFSH